MIKQIIIENIVANKQIIVQFGGGPGGGLTTEVAATYSAISASTTKRFIEVLADENYGNSYQLYFHNGTTLKQIFLV